MYLYIDLQLSPFQRASKRPPVDVSAVHENNICVYTNLFIRYAKIL